MNKEEIKHINWMYNRLISVHKENPNIDYMKRFKKIIDKQLALCSVVGQSEQLVCDHSKHTFFRVLNKERKCNGCGEIYEAN